MDRSWSEGASPFPGRDAEVGRLRAALEDPAAPGPRIVVLHGPPGAGKTSLARQLADEPGAARRLSVHRLALGERPADPERLILRLLLAAAVPRSTLNTALPGFIRSASGFSPVVKRI